MENKNPIHFLSILLFRWTKKPLFALFCILLLLLLTYNCTIILCFKFSPENSTGESIELPYPPIKERKQYPIPKLSTHLPKKQPSLAVLASKKRRKRKFKPKITIPEASENQFSTRAKEFFGANSCKLRFFMTWISSVDSFGERELFTIESLFKFNPSGCLLIVSNSMDSNRGTQILSPFLDRKFRVIAISPDFHYLFKHTPAEGWFNWLKSGKINPGEISLGQNLSNLLRLALLYKFGGVYLDTDFIILKSFSKLRNSIGAQTIDPETRDWSRLNNAVMIFDKGHPILYKFIEEFALTFDGNKWGHNGPYLVSRVVAKQIKKNKTQYSKINFEINILKPMAFYPVDWSRIGGFFHGPRNETHSKWLTRKFDQLRNKSYAIHLWNRLSQRFPIERGSIISRLISESCNISMSNL